MVLIWIPSMAIPLDQISVHPSVRLMGRLSHNVDAAESRGQQPKMDIKKGIDCMSKTLLSTVLSRECVNVGATVISLSANDAECKILVHDGKVVRVHYTKRRM